MIPTIVFTLAVLVAGLKGDDVIVNRFSSPDGTVRGATYSSNHGEGAYVSSHSDGFRASDNFGAAFASSSSSSSSSSNRGRYRPPYNGEDRFDHRHRRPGGNVYYEKRFQSPDGNTQGGVYSFGNPGQGFSGQGAFVSNSGGGFSTSSASSGGSFNPSFAQSGFDIRGIIPQGFLAGAAGVGGYVGGGLPNRNRDRRCPSNIAECSAALASPYQCRRNSDCYSDEVCCNCGAFFDICVRVNNRSRH